MPHTTASLHGRQKLAAEAVIRGKTIVKDDKKQASTKKMTPQSKVKKYNTTMNKSKTKSEESSACISVSRDVVDGIMELGEQLKEANRLVSGSVSRNYHLSLQMCCNSTPPNHNGV